MYKVFIDNRVSDGVAGALQVRHAVVIRLPYFRRLPAPVSSHADMLLFEFPDGRLLTFGEYYDLNPGLFDCVGDRLVLTDETPGDRYPNDVLLDALAVGDTLYGHESASRVFKNSFGSFVPVKQGYARCSVAVPRAGLAITADKGLAEALLKNGVEVLEICPGNIRLPGYDAGFIGGAGTRLPDGEFLFFGDVTAHPDYVRIDDFLNSHGVRYSFVPGEPLTDYGGAVFV